MKKTRQILKRHPTIALSVPAFLCFIQFCVEIFEVIKTGKLDSESLNQLASSANGFESVCLFALMVVLKSKKGDGG